jgi:hypothetical protein
MTTTRMVTAQRTVPLLTWASSVDFEGSRSPSRVGSATDQGPVTVMRTAPTRAMVSTPLGWGTPM